MKGLWPVLCTILAKHPGIDFHRLVQRHKLTGITHHQLTYIWLSQSLSQRRIPADPPLPLPQGQLHEFQGINEERLLAFKPPHQSDNMACRSHTNPTILRFNGSPLTRKFVKRLSRCSPRFWVNIQLPSTS